MEEESLRSLSLQIRGIISMWNAYIFNNSEADGHMLKEMLIRYMFECNEDAEIFIIDDNKTDLLAETAIYFASASDPKSADFLFKVRKNNSKSIVVIILSSLQELKEVMKPWMMPNAFLVKPIKYESLREQLQMIESVSFSHSTQTEAEMFFWSIKAKEYSIPIKEILFFESRNKKTFLVTLSKEYTVNKSLDSLEEDGITDFVRTHRSFYVNSKHIRECDYSKMLIVLDDGTKVFVSRRGKEKLKEAMK